MIVADSKTTFVTVNHLSYCHLALLLIHSKTTFVTVNLYIFSAFSRTIFYSKTTFVTVNLAIHGIMLIPKFNSKTTFVTVNLTHLENFRLQHYIQKQPLLLLIGKSQLLCEWKGEFKNNLCYC